MTRLLIVRHGETDWNAESRVQGHEDIPLNAEGRRQAAHAAEALAAEPVAAVYSSDLARAAQTARALAAPHGLEVVTTPGLRERLWGAWQGRTLAEIETSDPVEYQRHRSGQWVTPEGAEEYDALRDRVAAEIRRIAEAHPGETVAIATHGGPLKVFVCWLMGAPVSAHFVLRAANAGVTTVLVRNGRYILESYNTQHSDGGMQ